LATQNGPPRHPCGVSPTWKKSIPKKRDGLSRAIKRQVKAQREALDASRAKLDEAEMAADVLVRQQLLEQAWNGYRDVYDRSQVFFRECLEIIGGLTFRAMGIEENVYQLADELTKQCGMSTELMSKLAPTVPALPETLVKMLASIIGLRFPEWTIWNLPFTAHELGHVVQEEEDVRDAVSKGAEVWRKASGKGKRQSYVREIVADVYATYNMGPAYACAVVLLGFNPVGACVDGIDCPSDARRAHVVLSMLQRMSDEAAGEYDDIVQHLRDAWRSMLRRVGEPETLDAKETQDLEELVEAIERVLKDPFTYLSDSGYPYEVEGDGWLVARSWGTQWRSDLRDGDPLTDHGKDDLQEIADAAQALCEAIIAKRRKPKPPAGAPTPSAPR
jgi:hypothetical protein